MASFPFHLSSSWALPSGRRFRPCLVTWGGSGVSCKLWGARAAASLGTGSAVALETSGARSPVSPRSLCARVAELVQLHTGTRCSPSPWGGRALLAFGVCGLHQVPSPPTSHLPEPQPRFHFRVVLCGSPGAGGRAPRRGVPLTSGAGSPEGEAGVAVSACEQMPPVGSLPTVTDPFLTRKSGCRKRIAEARGQNGNEPTLEEIPELESWGCRVPQHFPAGRGSPRIEKGLQTVFVGEC